jgi:hypothetical protein
MSMTRRERTVDRRERRLAARMIAEHRGEQAAEHAPAIDAAEPVDTPPGDLSATEARLRQLAVELGRAVDA